MIWQSSGNLLALIIYMHYYYSCLLHHFLLMLAALEVLFQGWESLEPGRSWWMNWIRMMIKLNIVSKRRSVVGITLEGRVYLSYVLSWWMTVQYSTVRYCMCTFVATVWIRKSRSFESCVRQAESSLVYALLSWGIILFYFPLFIYSSPYTYEPKTNQCPEPRGAHEARFFEHCHVRTTTGKFQSTTKTAGRPCECSMGRCTNRRSDFVVSHKDPTCGCIIHGTYVAIK